MMSEEDVIVGIIGSLEGGYPARNWSLVLTPDRIVAAVISGATGGVRASIARGAVVLKGRALESRVVKETERLRRLSPRAILADDKWNYSIAYGGIQRVELTKPGLRAGKLLIQTQNRQHSFLLRDKANFAAHAKLLESALGEKLVWH